MQHMPDNAALAQTSRGIRFETACDSKRLVTNIAVELRESFLFGKISIPKSYDLIHIKFSGEVTSHPSISKIHENNVHENNVRE